MQQQIGKLLATGILRHVGESMADRQDKRKQLADDNIKGYKQFYKVGDQDY